MKDPQSTQEALLGARTITASLQPPPLSLPRDGHSALGVWGAQAKSSCFTTEAQKSTSKGATAFQELPWLLPVFGFFLLLYVTWRINLQ